MCGVVLSEQGVHVVPGVSGLNGYLKESDARSF
jgi:hypothetical protein